MPTKTKGRRAKAPSKGKARVKAGDAPKVAAVPVAPSKARVEVAPSVTDDPIGAVACAGALLGASREVRDHDAAVILHAVVTGWRHDPAALARLADAVRLAPPSRGRIAGDLLSASASLAYLARLDDSDVDLARAASVVDVVAHAVRVRHPVAESPALAEVATVARRFAAVPPPHVVPTTLVDPSLPRDTHAREVFRRACAQVAESFGAWVQSNKAALGAKRDPIDRQRAVADALEPACRRLLAAVGDTFPRAKAQRGELPALARDVADALATTSCSKGTGGANLRRLDGETVLAAVLRVTGMSMRADFAYLDKRRSAD